MASSPTPTGAPAARSPRPQPDPLEVDAVPVVAVGTALWGVALVVLLALRGTLDRHDAGWWVWVCAAGFALGLLGVWVTARRRAALRAAGRPAAEPGPDLPR